MHHHLLCRLPWWLPWWRQNKDGPGSQTISDANARWTHSPEVKRKWQFVFNMLGLGMFSSRLGVVTYSILYWFYWPRLWSYTWTLLTVGFELGSSDRELRGSLQKKTSNVTDKYSASLSLKHFSLLLVVVVVVGVVVGRRFIFTEEKFLVTHSCITLIQSN